MKNREKLRVMLPHWIEHNSGHGKEFAHWAGLLDSAGEKEIARLLKEAESCLEKADTALKEALGRVGGPLDGDEHHHHHH